MEGRAPSPFPSFGRVGVAAGKKVGSHGGVRFTLITKGIRLGVWPSARRARIFIPSWDDKANENRRDEVLQQGEKNQKVSLRPSPRR